MFFITVCSSFRGFKCVIQKSEDPKRIAGNLSDPKNSRNFVKPRKITANPEK